MRIPRLTATGIGLGIASTGATYALTHKHGVPAVRTTSPGVAFGVTTFGCMVLYPIIGTIAVHRELTRARPIAEFSAVSFPSSAAGSLIRRCRTTLGMMAPAARAILALGAMRCTALAVTAIRSNTYPPRARPLITDRLPARLPIQIHRCRLPSRQRDAVFSRLT